MAKITLYVEANTTKAESALADLRKKYDALSEKTVTIKVEAKGIDALSKEAMKAVNAAAKLQNATAKLNAQKLELAKSNNAVTISENNRIKAEKEATKASLLYGKQAEATRTQEARRRAEIEATAAALARKDVAEQNTATAAINSNKTQQQELERTKRKSLDLQIQQEKTATAQAGLAQETKKSSDKLKEQSTAMEKLAAAGKKFADHFVNTLGTRISQAIISAAVNATKDALNTMKAVDTELTNIRKVSDLTAEQVAAIGDAAYSTASKYGVSADEYLSAVYTYQKAGLGESAEQLAELSTKTMLVGDTTAEVASKFLIATNAAWGLNGSYEALNEVVDKADWINNRYATDLAKLSAGMPIVASTAANMNMTIDETLAVLGTITSLTQETGTKAATAWRALSMNIAGEIGTITDETGEEIEVTEEGIKSISDALEKYGNEAIKHAKATGEVIKPIEAVVSLAEAYRDGLLTDIELTNILMKVGGKLRTNQLTALVKDIAKGEGNSTYLKMLSDLGNAAGTADKEIALMMDSWERKTQVLKNTWTEFISNLVDTGTIKKGVELLTTVIEGLDTKVGRLGITIGGVTVAVGALFALFKTNLFVAAGTAIIALIAGAAGAAEKANETYRESSKALHELQDAIKDTNKEYSDTVRTTEASGAVAQMYIDKLKDLESTMADQRKRGLDVTEAQKEYHDTLVRLTNVVPELSSLIDLENDIIDGGTAALEKNTEAWIENAKAQAYQKMVAEQTEALVNAQIEKEKNELKLHNEQGTGYQDIIDNYETIFKEQAAALREAEAHALSEHRGNLIAEDFADYEAYIARGDWLADNENAYYEAGKQASQVLKAIAEYEETIKDAEEQLRLTQEAINKSGVEEPKDGGGEDKEAQADEQAARRKGQKKAATEDATQATREATQAENDYAAAANASGEAGEKSAVMTATAVREDTVPALKEVKEALDAIPEERSITLTPHFDEALEKIQQYITFLGYLKQNYTSVLTSSVRHYDPEHGVDTTSYVATGARAAGGTVGGGGPTLVNELGPELISENGRAYIAGGGKPAVVNLSPGAIVIPADQTREALKGGMPRLAAAQALNVNNLSNIPIPVGSKTGASAIIRNAASANLLTQAAALAANKSGGSGKGGSSGKSSGSSSPAKISFNFPELEKQLTSTLDLLEEQIKLAENEGDYPRVAELYEKAQEAIKDLADKYRQAGYGDDSLEVLKLLNKNYDYANKQLDLYQDKWDELIDALGADTDATKAAKELEEKRLALEEAQAAYENAQKQRTVRMYNAATGQWEWIADDKKIQNAQKTVESAEEAYAETVKKQAIAELEKMRDTVTDLSDVVLGPALSAVVTMAESSDQFQNFARALNAVFGVGSFLQSTEGTTKAISTVDSHDTTYSFGGISLTEEQAGSMSLKQLAQMLQVLKIT